MTSRKEGTRIVKNVGIWRRNEPLGRDFRRARAVFVMRIHVYRFTPPHDIRSLCITHCTLAALNTLIEARGPFRCFERLRAKTGWQTLQITWGMIGFKTVTIALLFYIKWFINVIWFIWTKKELRIMS